MSSQKPDSSPPHVDIVFASCNRQDKPQNYWKDVQLLHPKYLLWTGDAVYAKSNKVDGLQRALTNLTSNAYYSSFLNYDETNVTSTSTSSSAVSSNHNNNRVIVDGVWDDHDFGVNDGGRFVKDIEPRSELFLNFLAHGNTAEDVQSVLYETRRRVGRGGAGGLYHTRDITISTGHTLSSNADHHHHHRHHHEQAEQEGTEGGEEHHHHREFVLKILFLDTRSFRDDHFVPSLGQFRFPLSALLSSAIRGAYSVLGFGRQYTGRMLGEKQWQWLEEEIRASTADAHIIVSSVQVLTSNPVFESWGHFPAEKQRLFSLLQKLDPPGLTFLSGDVHLGELSAAKITRSDGSVSSWVEVTSSGMTHTCGDGAINKLLCPLMMRMFSEHRLRPLQPQHFGIDKEADTDINANKVSWGAEKENYFIGRNIGSISVAPLSVENGGSKRSMLAATSALLEASTVCSASGTPEWWQVKYNVHSLESDDVIAAAGHASPPPATVLTQEQLLPHCSSFSSSSTHRGHGQLRAPIDKIQYADFPLLSPSSQMLILVVVLYILLYLFPGPLFMRYYTVRRWKAEEEKEQKELEYRRKLQQQQQLQKKKEKEA